MSSHRNYPRTTLAAILVAIAVRVPSYPAGADEVARFELGPDIASRVEALVGELDGLYTTPFGLIPLVELTHLGQWFPPALLIEPLTRLLQAPEGDPLVRAMMGHRLAQAYLTAGDLETSEQLIQEQGFLTRWSITGPFPNEGMSGFSTAYDPEHYRSPEATYAGRFGETRFRDVTGLSRLGYVDLSALAQPAHSSVVYAATRIESDVARPALLWTCVDGAFKVWLNGELVALVERDLGGSVVREWWDIELTEGANQLLVKVAAEDGPMGFSMKLTGPDMNPLTGWDSSGELEESEVEVEVEVEVEQQQRSLPRKDIALTLHLAWTDDALEVPLSRSEARLGSAMVLAAQYSRDPQETWRLVLEEYSDCNQGSPREQYWCSRVLDQYWERSRALDRAIEEVPESDSLRPWILLARAELDDQGMGEDHRHRSATTTQALLDAYPGFVPGLVLQGRIRDRQGLYWSSIDSLTRALRAAPDSPEVVYEAQASLRDAGSSPELIDLYRRQARLDATDTSVLLWLAPALVQAGLTDEALQVVDRALVINPLSLSLHHLKANLLFNQGDIEGARATHLTVVERFPTSPLALEEWGRFEVRAGDIAAAGEAFGRSLAIQPQNRELTDYLAEIQAEEETFFSSLAIDPGMLSEFRLPPEQVSDRDYYYLVDQRITHLHANGVGTRYVQQAYQIQTRSGADALRQIVIEFTPDAEVVRILSARVVKPDGSVEESFTSWEESLSQPWYGLYYDVRGLILGFDDLAPGDILEIQYTVSSTTSQGVMNEYFGDFWYVQDLQPKSLARFGVLHPAEIELAMRLPELPHTMSEEVLPSGVLDLIEVRNIPQVQRELNMPGYSSVADYIHVSTFDSWETVAAWYWNLIEDELATSPEIEATVARLVEGRTTTRQRISAIHEYVVRNTRYVGLEFGVHGYRPYRTTTSFARRFGDCKDTAALLKVMLQAAGIESHIALVRTSDRGLVDSYPASLAVFNHAIAYVPELDLYLDGTTGHNGFSELPAGDQGASALIVLDGRGYRSLVTPYLPAADNRTDYRFEVDLSQDDSPATGFIRATGQSAPPMRLRYEAVEQRVEEFEKEFRRDFPGAEVTDLSFTDLDDINRPVEVSFHFNSVNYLRTSGTSLLLYPLGVESALASRLAGSATRRQPLLIGPPLQIAYQVQYTLPPRIVTRLAQTRWDIASPFGHFTLDLSPDGDRLDVEALVEINQPQVSVDDYADFRAFIIEIDRIINQSIPLVPREEG